MARIDGRLIEIEVLWDQVEDRMVYPFSIPAIASLQTLSLDWPVTFLVGKNGSGKSTLLEGENRFCTPSRSIRAPTASTWSTDRSQRCLSVVSWHCCDTSTMWWAGFRNSSFRRTHPFSWRTRTPGCSE
jgi:energy-coupling factor transporter ATP-binding protein EcfA2